MVIADADSVLPAATIWGAKVSFLSPTGKEKSEMFSSVRRLAAPRALLNKCPTATVTKSATGARAGFSGKNANIKTPERAPSESCKRATLSTLHFSLERRYRTAATALLSSAVTPPCMESILISCVGNIFVEPTTVEYPLRSPDEPGL